ncbi:hypothetical protein JNJ66_01910 [Candidatus Saccharibacteria bacterium]|nr:hypothetical protein [Candidatus Saccharibacteria bacterium]
MAEHDTALIVTDAEWRLGLLMSLFFSTEDEQPQYPNIVHTRWAPFLTGTGPTPAEGVTCVLFDFADVEKPEDVHPGLMVGQARDRMWGVIYVSGPPEALFVEQVIRAGAHLFLPTPEPEPPAPELLSRFDEHDLLTLHCLALGDTAEKMARRCGVSFGTAKSRIASVRRKLTRIIPDEERRGLPHTVPTEKALAAALRRGLIS